MARPRCCRHVGFEPRCCYFKPRGIPLVSLEVEMLSLDELEAVRLADQDGLYQTEAARRMQVSRPTFGRIIESAHRKIAGALVKGKALKIAGGKVQINEAAKPGMAPGQRCLCPRCGKKVPHRQGIPCRKEKCPGCGTRMVREGCYNRILTATKKKKGV